MIERQKIVHLQTLRAIASSIVIAAHALEYPVRRNILPDDMYRLAWSVGWIAVSTFFIISGVIMIRSASDGFGSSQNAVRFAMRRLIRIVPIYWLMIPLFAAATLLRGEQITGEMVIKTMFFIPYVSETQGVIRPIVGQGWTLNYEMFFYMLFALCLAFPRRIGLTILIGLFPVLVIIHSSIWPLIPYSDPVSMWQFWSDPITLPFVVGLIIGLAELNARRWHRATFPAVWTLFIFALMVLAFVTLGGSFPMQIWWQAAFTLVSAIAVVICTSRGGHRIASVGRVAETAGDASYSTYLIHPLILMVLAAIWDRLPSGLQSPLLFVLLALIICNIGGYVHYRLIESPLTKWLYVKFEKRRTA